MGICEKFVKGLSEYFLSLTQVRDDLVTDDSSQVLSARQGVVLRELVESNILAKLQFKVVMVLPEMGDSGVIYLTNKQSINDSEVYDQYVFIEDWVLLGSTVINLSDYYTKSEVDFDVEIIKDSKADVVHIQQDSTINVTTNNYGNVTQEEFNSYLSYDMIVVKQELEGLDEALGDLL